MLEKLLVTVIASAFAVTALAQAPKSDTAPKSPGAAEAKKDGMPSKKAAKGEKKQAKVQKKAHSGQAKGLDRADQAAGAHGSQGREKAREVQRR